MAKEKSEAKPRASLLKRKKAIENFTGIHDGEDVKAVPYDGNPIEIKMELTTGEVSERIKISYPPPAHIEVEQDEIKRKTDALISGKPMK